MRLERATALVTGAARRVGRAIALRLARAGCNVAVHYRGSKAPAEQTAAECRQAGVRAIAVRADLERAAAPQQLVRRVLRHFGGLNILINNASIFETMDLEHFDLAAWRRTLQVNLTAPVALVHAAHDALRSTGGRVVNLCDAATARPWPGYLAYMTSKGALETVTRCLARELAPEVNVVGIAPGVVAWPADYTPARRQRITQRIPLKRAGAPEDVASLVHFVLTEGDFLTGIVIPVDGGRGIA